MVQLQTAMSSRALHGLHRLQLYSGIALAIMALVSVVLGWLVAGRVLAPLRTITAAADRISDTNLHERLAMSGPRDELRLLADTIDRLLARLEAAFDAQRRFVANASHELRTPLAMMRTTLDVADRQARRRAGPDPRAGGRAARGSRPRRPAAGELPHSGPRPERPARRSATTSRSSRSSPPRSATAPPRSPPRTSRSRQHLDAVEVAGSPTLLRRMIENVIENAVRHTEPGGSVEIALAPLDGRAGASGHRRAAAACSTPDAVAQLAQPFTRLSQDRTGSQDGHGLGLSIVAAVAAAHGGQLDLHARAEGGLQCPNHTARRLPPAPRAGHANEGARRRGHTPACQPDRGRTARPGDRRRRRLRRPRSDREGQRQPLRRRPPRPRPPRHPWRPALPDHHPARRSRR